MKGTVIKAFRAYGFIQGEDGNVYHYKPTYEVGDRVEFEPSENDKGHEAINVRKEGNNESALQEIRNINPPGIS